MVEFFENNDICPTCEQTLDNSEEMIALKEKEVSKFSAALKELEDKNESTQFFLADPAGLFLTQIHSKILT